MEFLSMAANNLGTTVDFFLTDERFTDMLHKLCMVHLHPFGIHSFSRDSFESAQFGSILSGTKREHYRSQPGYRVPRGNRNAANIAEGDNPDNNLAVNGNQNGAEGGNEGADNAADGDGDGADNAADGDGDGAEGGNGGGVPRRLTIYRYQFMAVDMSINLMDPIPTNINPSNCQSWNDLAENILLVWRHRDVVNLNYPVDHVTPPTCWPRAFTIFGNRSDDNRFQSYDWRNELHWEHARTSMDCVLAIEIVNGRPDIGVDRLDELGRGPIFTYIYRLQLQQMQIDLASISNLHPANDFQSWDNLAQHIFERYLSVHNLNNVGNPNFIDTFDCWPRAVTLFGTWVRSISYYNLANF
ncbi:hypothetical protein RND81_11G182100 [Saponaria officinalis]|uniref:Uncharacterized protein n=1 Tax=Saponaria officinalis TaxID=3572 RepID=A0AAW1HP09_SAPOF